VIHILGRIVTTRQGVSLTGWEGGGRVLPTKEECNSNSNYYVSIGMEFVEDDALVT